LTTKEGKGNLFTIECYMPSFEPQNKSVRKRYASIFKNDKYTFNSQKDLLLSMPYRYVANLQPGELIPLDNQWLKNLRIILKQAKLNSIKQIRLARLLRTNYIGNCTITLRNSNENVIYEAVTDTNDTSYFVNLDQVYDIVGEEDWIHGKVNCLSNIALDQTITLSW
jgi:hypothetical protein